MATASSLSRMVTVKTVTLQLSEEEARTLLAVCGFIGGSPEKSPRGHMEKIEAALSGALGVRFDQVPEHSLVRRRNEGISFSEYDA